MVETLVLVPIKIYLHVLEVSVHQQMVHGEVGLPGHLVEAIVRSQDPEAVIIHLQQMEESTVQVQVKEVHPVMEVCVH